MRTSSGPRDNRRREPRFVPNLEEVLWRTPGDTAPARRGCLRDVSCAGLAFVSGRRRSLEIGEELKVQMMGEPQDIVDCEVVWIQNGKQLSAVGCRVVQPDSQPLPDGPPRKRMATCA